MSSALKGALPTSPQILIKSALKRSLSCFLTLSCAQCVVWVQPNVWAQAPTTTSQDPKQSPKQGLSERERYEREVSLKALKAAGWRLVERPEGAEIIELHALSLPVFLPDERGGAWLSALNLLHKTTRPYVVTREARLQVGGRFEPALALETERNLRGSGLFTSALVFAVEPRARASSHKREVKQVAVVIVTRDLWSLRLESDFSYVGGQLGSLALNLTERNLDGRRQALSLRTYLTPFTFTSSLALSNPRFGSNISAGGEAGLIWSRRTGQREGQYVVLSVGRPLYNLDQAWALKGSVELTSRVARLTRGAAVLLDEPNDPSLEPRAVEWGYQRYAVGLSLTRQWRGALQKALSLSLGGNVSRHELPNDLEPAREALWRSTYINPNLTQLGPSVSASVYERRFVALSDVSTYGLSEDLSLGGSASSSLSISALGDRALTPALSLQWTGLFGTEGARAGFWRARLSATARLQEANISAAQPEGWVNRAVGVRLYGASPMSALIGGRVVWSALLSGLWSDSYRTVVSLGGDSGLRGYPAQALYQFGGHLAKLNLEYRSRPLVWSFAHLGGALFYDVGALGSTLNTLVSSPKQGVGGGVRLLMPQLNRSVFRFDLATPLQEAGWSALLSVSSSQAFSLMPWE